MTGQPPRMTRAPRRARFAAGIARVGLALALASVVPAALSGFGYQFGWWELPAGFLILRVAVYGAVAGVALGLLALILAPAANARPTRVAGTTALVIGLGVTAPPVFWLYRAQTAPPIHDVTTDFDDPPRFEAALAPRREAPNDSIYPGKEVAILQRGAYPDLAPLRFPAAPALVFERALEVARDMGWHVIAAEPAERRVEATATSFWFGFHDDVVVRVTPDGSGSRIDVRSASRAGRSDLGTNARRVRMYLAHLHERLSGEPAQP